MRAVPRNWLRFNGFDNRGWCLREIRAMNIEALLECNDNNFGFVDIHRVLGS